MNNILSTISQAIQPIEQRAQAGIAGLIHPPTPLPPLPSQANDPIMKGLASIQGLPGLNNIQGAMRGVMGDKQYQEARANPMINISGEMVETPGLGLKSGIVDASDAQNINTWSTYIKDPKTGKLVENANFKQGEGNPTQYAQKAPDYPQAEPQTGKVPTMESSNPKQQVPGRPSLPKQPDLTVRQQAIQKLNGIDNYQLPSHVFGKNTIPLEQIDKSVMHNDIGGNTVEQVLQKLPKAYEKTWNQAETIAASDQNPIDVPSQVVPYLQKYMDRATSDGLIPQGRAQVELNSYLTRLYARVNADLMDTPSTSATPVDVNNSNISLSQLLRIKTAANHLVDSAYDSNGNLKPSLTTEQQVNLALKNGMDDALTNANPNIKAATMKLNSMERIARNISPNLRNQSLTVSAGIPGTNIHIPLVPFSGTMRRIAASTLNGSPLGLGALGAAGVIAGKAAIDNQLPQKAFDSIENMIGYEKKSVPQDTGIGSQAKQDISYKNPSNHNDIIAPDVNGDYSLPVATEPKDTQYMTDAQRRASEANMSPNNPEYGRIQTNWQTSQKLAEANLPNNTTAFMSNAPSYMDSINTVNHDFKTIPTDFLKHFKNAQEWAAYMSSPDNPYAKQLSDIDNLNAQFIAAYQQVNGTNPGKNQFIAPGDSSNQMQEKWKGMLNFIHGSYAKYQDPWLAYSSSSGTQTPQGQPAPVSYQSPPEPQSAAGLMQGGAIPQLNLPPIGGLPPIGQ